MSRVTIKDIARRLLLSNATVSRALTGDNNIRPETRDKVLAMAREMGYRANPVARNLQSKRTNTVGVIVPEMVTPFYPRIVDGVQKILYDKHLKVIIAQTNESPEREREVLRMMEDFMVDGIIIGICHKSINKDEYLRIMKDGTPIVFCDRMPEGMDVHRVIVDDYVKSFFLVEHLIRSGHRRIAHIRGPEFISGSYDRMRGYRDALEKFKIPYDGTIVIESRSMDYSDGQAAAQMLLDKKLDFDAIFGFTDTVSIGAMNHLIRNGYKVPDDIAVASFSGSEMSEILMPSLTSVEQPREKMGEACAELILELIKNPSMPPKSIVLDAEIKYRESTEKE